MQSLNIDDSASECSILSDELNSATPMCSSAPSSLPKLTDVEKKSLSRETKSAFRILDRLGKKAEKDWSQQERESHVWATGIATQFNELMKLKPLRHFATRRQRHPTTRGAGHSSTRGSRQSSTRGTRHSTNLRANPSLRKSCSHANDASSRSGLSNLAGGQSVVATGPAPKRRRSTDEESNASKKTKSLTISKPFSETVKDGLIVAIVDLSDDEGKISYDKWRLIEGRVMNCLYERITTHPNSPPTFKDAGWHQGYVKLIACDDQNSVDFITTAVGGIGEIWPGAKLKAVERSQIPHRPKARIWVPLEPAEPAKILGLIAYQNPDLPVKDWKAFEDPSRSKKKDSDTKKNGRSLVISLTAESLPLLQAKEFMIRCGLKLIEVKLFATDRSCIAGPSNPATSALPRVQIPDDDPSSPEDLNATVVERSESVDAQTDSD